MEYYRDEAAGAIFVTFDPGDLLLEGLQDVLRREEVDFGVIPCGVGTLAEAHILFAANVAGELPRIRRVVCEGAVEVGSLQGPILDGDPHAHMVLYNFSDGQMYVGHLEPGCRVLNRMEVVIQPSAGPKLRRVTDPETGTYHIQPREA